MTYQPIFQYSMQGKVTDQGDITMNINAGTMVTSSPTCGLNHHACHITVSHHGGKDHENHSVNSIVQYTLPTECCSLPTEHYRLPIRHFRLPTEHCISLRADYSVNVINHMFWIAMPHTYSLRPNFPRLF